MSNRLKNFNTLTFLLTFLLVFVYIWYKAIHVPITHDEVATTIHYSNYSSWEIMMYPDPWPNNHILNTLLSKGVCAILGNEPWMVRLPNVLSFLIYAIGVYRILELTISNRSRFYIPAALLFVLSPYVLDFFGLNRGYGLSIAFCTLSASHLISGFKYTNTRNIGYAFILSVVASYANFTLLVFWVATTVLVGFYLVIQYASEKRRLWKLLAALFGISALYAALIGIPIYKMQSTNQFEYWTSNGFVRETIHSVVQNSKYGSRVFLTSDFLTWFALAVLGVNLCFIFWKWRTSNYQLKTVTNPLSIAAFLLIGTALINIVQCWLLGVPNLNGRTALFFYPLFMILLVSSHQFFPMGDKYHLKKTFSIVMFLFFVHHVVHTMQPHTVREWEYDANTCAVLKRLKMEHPKGKATLETNWLFNPSFAFYTQTGKVPWLHLAAYNKSINVSSTADYYYIMATDFALLEGNYEVLIRFPNNCWLLKRRNPSI
ncbi:hypothetical protein OAU25_01980 [Crocinitomicaceae bacterium]|nr:hypothetical protein [Crocinitomicaceae bacterium]